MASLIAFFRMIGWRNLLLVILAATVFFLIRSQFYAKNPAQPRVISLFDKVEYVRELRLVTHFSEELLEIGVQDALARKLQKQEEKLENIRLLARQLQEKEILASEYAGKVSNSEAQLERRKRELINRRDSLNQDFRATYPGRRITAREIARILREHPNAFSSELREKVRFWSMLPSEQDEKQLFNKEIREMAEEERLEKKESYDVRLAELEQQLDQVKVFLSQVKDERKRAEKEARRSISDAVEAQLELEQDSVLYEELKIDLANQQIDPLPKLLAVVSTEVTAYVDLQGMESDLDGQSLFLCGIPPAQVDSNVRIRLSTDNRFLTASRLTDLIPRNSADEVQKGVYYHVYEEIKEALAEMESEAITHAIDRGILEEADGMARQYLEQMGRSLGFNQVNVRMSCEESVPEENTAPVERSDSILKDTELIRDRSNSLDDMLFDSLNMPPAQNSVVTDSDPEME